MLGRNSKYLRLGCTRVCEWITLRKQNLVSIILSTLRNISNVFLFPCYIMNIRTQIQELRYTASEILIWMLIHTGLSSASTLGFPLGSVSSLPSQLWILQLSTWMSCSDLLANYPWNIWFLAHTREKRYWPVCFQPLLACPMALCFCPYPRTSESPKSARHFSAFSASP